MTGMKVEAFTVSTTEHTQSKETTSIFLELRRKTKHLSRPIVFTEAEREREENSIENVQVFALHKVFSKQK